MASDRPTRVTLILSYIASLFMFAMLTLTFCDVIGRYFLNAPITGAGEIIAFLMGLTIFLGFPLVTRDQEHITVSLFERYFKGRFRYVQRLFVLIGTLAMIGFYVYLITDQAATMRRWETITEELDLPQAPLVYVLAFLVVVAFIMFLPVIWRFLRKGEDQEAIEHHPMQTHPGNTDKRA